MDKGMKTRWISLYVENQVGVLSKISGLFSGKSYNLDSLTVGTTEDPTVSRMTIAKSCSPRPVDAKFKRIIRFSSTSSHRQEKAAAVRRHGRRSPFPGFLL